MALGKKTNSSGSLFNSQDLRKIMEQIQSTEISSGTRIVNIPSLTVGPPSPTVPQRRGLPTYKEGDKVEYLGVEYLGAYFSNDSQGYKLRKGDVGIFRHYINGNTGATVDFPDWPDFRLPIEEFRKAKVEEKTDVPLPRTVVEFDSVIIDDEKRQQILEALEQINQQHLIFNKWGFAGTIEKGRGVSLLFYGPPGTGKTLMAQAIANKMKHELCVIATADLESSAPGETQRNIRKHFDEAKGKKRILLFDECDSVIFSRSNTGPIMGAMINELLTNLEKHDGLTIFTTNRLGTLDEAVNRRLALKLEFDMPTKDQRVLIWQRMFPKKAPLADDIDWERLAILEITGGYIKNAVLRAARMAAVQDMPDKQKKITMDHLLRATTQEASSMASFEQAKAEHEKHGVHVMQRHDGGNISLNKQVEMHKGINNG